MDIFSDFVAVGHLLLTLIILVIFPRTGETGNEGKGRENRCRTRDFRGRVYTRYEFILYELYYKK